MAVFDLPDLPPEAQLTRPPVIRTPQPSVSTDCRESGGCLWLPDRVFAEVIVQPTIRTGSLITWTLDPNFDDPGPYEYQLLAGTTGNPNADDWEAVGSAAVDASYLVDDVDRLFGKTNWTHYRVCLTTPNGTYFSPPTSSWGRLSFSDRNILRNLYEAHQTDLRMQSGVSGFLLKRRLLAKPCVTCRDYLTEDTTDPNCPDCFGSGSTDGYFDPIPCVYAALDPKATYNNITHARGTADDRLRVRAKMLAIPQLFSQDVWVDGNNDNRWYIHDVQNVVEWRGVPVLLSVELRLAVYSDVIYKLTIPDELPDPLKSIPA